MTRWAGFLLLVAGGARALTQGPYFVQGSWVNVRADASANGVVTAHVVTNTKVDVLATQAAACEIRWSDGRGFLPCKLLGPKALTLDQVSNATRADGSANPDYSPPRAFWLAPSADALMEAGNYFQQRLLSKAQYAREQGQDPEQLNEHTQALQPPLLLRYPVPEFEAMKALLAQGVRAAQSEAFRPGGNDCPDQPAPPARQQPPFAQGSGDGVYEVMANCRVAGLPDLRLPAVRPSLFRSSDELASAEASVDELSQTFGLREQGKVLAGPRWMRGYDFWHYTGAWDIGRYLITLEKPVVEEVIGRTGLVGAYVWTPHREWEPNTGIESCDDGLRYQRMGKTLLPEYPGIKDGLIWFEAPQALPFRHATVHSQLLKLPADVQVNSTQKFEKVASYEVDLNGDGVPDFVQWDVWGTSGELGPGGSELWLRAVFVNVAGHWAAFAADYERECT
jgi:hypothetical protein